MEVLAQPLHSAEFLVVDTETNGCGGEECELTEVGAVLVGGAELHDRFESLIGASQLLSRKIQRFTGISQAMVDLAPPPEEVLPDLARRMSGRVMVAHNAAFDRRVLRQAFARAQTDWPDPPVLCTIALARRFAPLVRRRGLAALAAEFDIPQARAHRALADAETCARVFCALFRRLCANAETVGDALAMFERRRRSRRRLPPGRMARGAPATPAASLDFSALPAAPGVYVFRDAEGRPLYAGKSVSLRTRARSHFAPGAESAQWTGHAATVEHTETGSELGALVLENRTIKALRPPGNVVLKRVDGFVYLRCRLDIAFPIFEVGAEPATGHAVSIGPLRGRSVAAELVAQLNSLFGLRRCGRGLPRREHPSAYGQMGRCLSPCLGDLDPNLYRRRLDQALALFTGPADGRDAILAHVDEEMRAAARRLSFERAETLRRRRERLEVLVTRAQGALRATHVDDRLVVAEPVRADGQPDAFWIVEGRLADWGPLPGADELVRRTALALAGRSSHPAPAAARPAELDEARILGAWIASHKVGELALTPAPDAAALGRLARRGVSVYAPR